MIVTHANAVVERALTDNGIRSIRIDQGSKSAIEKFSSNPNILVLLLHGYYRLSCLL